MESPSTRPFVCSECETRFTTKLFLKRHSAVHSSSRNYSCEYCPSEYKYKKGLNRHLKKFHPDYYNSLKLTPFKKNIRIKIEEEQESSSFAEEKCEKNCDSLESSSESQLSYTLESKNNNFPPVEIAKPQVVLRSNQEQINSCIVPALIMQNLPIQGRETFKMQIDEKNSDLGDGGNLEDLNNFKGSANLVSASGLAGFNGPSTTTSPSLNNLNNFNKVLFENFLQFSSNVFKHSSKVQKDSSKGFVQVKEEKSGRDPKVLQMNANKRIEFLEDCIRKYQISEAALEYEIDKVLKENEKFEIKIKKFKEKLRKSDWKQS